MELWRQGDDRADSQVAVAEELRNDLLWRRRALELRTTESLQFAYQGGFARHPRPHGLRDKALSAGPDAAGAIYTDAAGSQDWGASLGDLYTQGMWSEVALQGGTNWRELRVLREALRHWRSSVKRKLVIVRMGDATTVAHANHGAGRSNQLAILVHLIREREVVSGRAAAAGRAP